MTRRMPRKTIDKTEYKKYQRVAEHFFEAAADSLALEYWTAAGVLIVHSAIAFTDAACIQQSGQRSAGDDHEDAIELLNLLIAHGEGKNRAIGHLRRIIEEKTKVSYLGDLYTAAQAKDLWKHLERFRSWIENILNR
jgi:hypothetical protein